MTPNFVFIFISGGYVTRDPCEPGQHRELNDNRRSTGYRLGSHESPLCDVNLADSWYRFTGDAGGKMAEQCPRRGQETHLKDPQRFFIRGYEAFRQDREDRHKGGILTLIKISIPAVETSRSGKEELEHHTVKLLLPSGELLITNCYSPPGSALALHKCGTVSPIWMNDTHPSVPGPAEMKWACVYLGDLSGAATCCSQVLAIGVKNCGHFFVYYLKASLGCPIAYCAGTSSGSGSGGSSSTSGGSGSTSGGSGSTSGGSGSSQYPTITVAPTLNGPVVAGHSFRFTCDFTYQHHQPDLMFEVQWTFDGQADPNIPNMKVPEPGRQAILPGSLLKGHLGTKVGCQVRGWYESGTHTTHKRAVPTSPWKPSHNDYFAGIHVSPRQVTVRETGGHSKVVLSSTIPIVCDHHFNGACCIYVMLRTHGPANNVQVPTPHSCAHALCTSDWNPSTHTASTTVTLQATPDGIPDGNKFLDLKFEPVLPVFGGGYLDAFANYTIPPVKVGEEKSDGPEVQARTVPCAGQTACQCGVAIREHEDVIRISNCGHRDHGVRIQVNHQPLRPGTVIRRSPDSMHVLVQMPSGRSVKVDVERGWHATTLTVPASDQTQGGKGVCGTPGGNAAAQFKHRNGYADPNPCGSSRYNLFWHRMNHGCIPVNFLESWKNSQSTSLFYDNVASHPPSSGTPAPTNCQCDVTSGHAHSNCTAPTTPPSQTCTGQCQNVTSQVPPWITSHWQPASGKRDVLTGLYLDTDEPDPPVNLTRTSPSGWNATWPTPSGIREVDARLHCDRALFGSQFFSHCRHLTHLLDFSLDSCIWTSCCQFELMQDSSSYVTDSQGKMVLREQVTEVCGVGCLRHGRCVRGQCVCEAGFTGVNCQLVSGRGPQLSRIRTSSTCDVKQRPCRKIYIDAENFEAGDNLLCKLQEYQAGLSTA
ncbi:von Willebrand factor D and EGF domain-containing protein-like [Babylonia areolata]|uniref:von Willebrand factor D and EGF domain-containing protein-like n=1 Tax=Babylonia areolata TaxID=304850 RepID=UPI003FD0BE6E